VLELPDDIAVHRTFRIYYTVEGVPFEVTVMIQGGHLYGLQYRQATREPSQAPQRSTGGDTAVSSRLTN
jgi:hypothetical protein